MTELSQLTPAINNTRIYNLSSGPHIVRFSAVAAKFRVNVSFEVSEHRVQTADDDSKLTSKAF